MAQIQDHNDKLLISAMVVKACELKKLCEDYDNYEKEQQEKERQLNTIAKPKKKRKTCWVQPFLQRRLELGCFENLMQELKQETPELFENFTRTEYCLFQEIVEKVTPYIERQETQFRKPLPPGLRVAITLRFLATGESYKSLQYTFRVSKCMISRIVPETCKAIYKAFKSELKTPETEEEWRSVAEGFERKWNFPNCLGSFDGKHVRLRNPANAGSKYYNYKKFFSMVLLALVDSEYRFLYIDCGAVGGECDAGIFAQTRLKKLVETERAHIPDPKPLPNCTDPTPCEYFFIGDDAFALRHYLMKPYPARALTRDERIFNYRLSRARRTVENAFGILANRWRVFHTSITLQPDNVESVIIAACVLHNLIRNRKLRNRAATGSHTDVSLDLEEEELAADLQTNQLMPLPHVHNRANTKYAINQRHRLRECFVSEAGSVTWQQSMI